MMPSLIESSFFDQEPLELAQSLIGLVLRHRINHPTAGRIWLSAKVVETEAYYLEEKGSHSSLGFTEKRKAMFMSPGTIYMYYARGGDSLNFSARGKGNGVLIKSGVPHLDRKSPQSSLGIMHELNPVNGRERTTKRLCAGQTLFCRSLGLKVPEWNQQQLLPGKLILENVGHEVPRLVQARRLGIPEGRDEHLPYRFVDPQHVESATKNPLKTDHQIIVR